MCCPALCPLPDPAPCTLCAQFIKSTVALQENFTFGLDPESLYVLLDKGCCANYPLPKYSANIAIAQDVVHGVKVRVVSCRCVAMCVCARVKTSLATVGEGSFVGAPSSVVVAGGV